MGGRFPDARNRVAHVVLVRVTRTSAVVDDGFGCERKLDVERRPFPAGADERDPASERGDSVLQADETGAVSVLCAADAVVADRDL
jgi:hypothetical protein